MSEKIRESISALMDGEASDFETRRVLESMDNSELRDTWARYHAASAAMKRDSASTSLNVDISAAVSQAIAKEDALVESRNRPMKTVAGFATAATIAFAAVIGVQSFKSEDEHGVPVIAASAVASSARVAPVALAANAVAYSAGAVNTNALNTRRYAPPIAAPSATLVSGSSFSHPIAGIQPVSMSSSAAFVDDANQVRSPANELAAQRQMETYLARHAELAGWRPATTETSMQAQESAGGKWQARWVPNGYRLVAINNDVASDSSTPVLTSVYSNGLSAFSVFVSSAHDEPSMDMRRGATIACSRRIQASGNAYTATVVGEIPQLAAERVATSVYQLPTSSH